MITATLLLLAAFPQEAQSRERLADQKISWENPILVIHGITGEPIPNATLLATDLWQGRQILSPGFWGADYGDFLYAKTWQRISDAEGRATVPDSWYRVYVHTPLQIGVASRPRHGWTPPFHVELFPKLAIGVQANNEKGEPLVGAAIGTSKDAMNRCLFLTRTDHQGRAAVEYFSQRYLVMEDGFGLQLMLPTAANTHFPILDTTSPPSQVNMVLPVGPRLEINYRPPRAARPPHLVQLRMLFESGDVTDRIVLGSTSGSFRFPLVDPGAKLYVIVEDIEERYSGYLETMVPEEAQGLVRLDIPLLWDTFLFTGQLLDEKGMPLANHAAMIDLFSLEDMEPDGGPAHRQTLLTDEQGKFRITTEDWIGSFQGFSILCQLAPGQALRADFLDRHAARSRHVDLGEVRLMPAD